MPRPRSRSHPPTTIIVQGGGGGDGPNPSDAFSLRIRLVDSNVVPADAPSFAFTFPDANATPADLLRLGLTYADTNAGLADLLLRLGVGLIDANVAPTEAAALVFNLTLPETNAAPTETAKLAFTLTDSTLVPTDSRSGLAKLWGTASAGAGVTTPANADGVNGGTPFAVVSTAPAGSATEILTSNCGNAAGAGTVFTSVVFRGWYKLNTVLASSTAKVVLHSSTAAFTDLTIETIAAVNTTNDHLTTPFSVDVSATVNTLAKLQSAQIVYTTIDAVAGVSPAIVTVDASSLELTGVL